MVGPALAVKAVLAAVLVASILRAFRGPPAPRPYRRTAHVLLAVTAVAYVTGAMVAAALGATAPAALLVWAGIECACVGVWLGRARGDDDDGGGGGGPGGGGGETPPPAWDWDAFDRARAEWARRPRRRTPA